MVSDLSVIALALLSVFAGSALGGCTGTEPPLPDPLPPMDARLYDLAQLTSSRAQKDEMLRNAADSPIPDSLRGDFSGLNYYPPDPEFAYQLQLYRYAHPVEVQVAASGGDVRQMYRFGAFTFLVNDTPCTLAVYKYKSDDPHLFVPFADATNGAETYEVGRYLDLEELPEGQPYLLDFNRAYNPYCAYNERYTCPLVPIENQLSVAIRAGERLPVKHSS
jgi:uncharacterized protein (DUF1684 family)